MQIIGVRPMGTEKPAPLTDKQIRQVINQLLHQQKVLEDENNYLQRTVQRLEQQVNKISQKLTYNNIY